MALSRTRRLIREHRRDEERHEAEPCLRGGTFIPENFDDVGTESKGVDGGGDGNRVEVFAEFAGLLSLVQNVDECSL